MRQRRNPVRVILKDGTEWMDRIRMIVSSSTARTRKTICLEVPHKRDMVRIDNADIKEVVTAELKYGYAYTAERPVPFAEAGQMGYGAMSAP